MDNDITKLLHIKDSGIHIIGVYDKNDTRTIALERYPETHYCPVCQCRMYSKGTRPRTVKHQMTQDGFHLVLEIRQRRWQCINPDCKHMESDSFSFIEPRRRTTNLNDIMIVKAFKDPTASAAEIARRFNVSPTHAITTFSRYVDMPRRQLPEILCVDEVFLGISKKCNYALVLQDFVTGEPIDMIINRRNEITEPYFNKIPYKEISRVKYLVSDMYRPYQEYVKNYFPNAIPVVDSFHVIKLINTKFLAYIRSVLRKYDQQDRERHERLEQEFHRQITFKHSKDYLLLKRYNWMLLKNARNLKYYSQPKMNWQLGRMMNTYDYMEWLFKLDPSFEERRKLKEVYIDFNIKYAGDPKGARKALSQIIALYANSKYEMFRETAQTLTEFFEAIINSFILVERHRLKGDYASRLSNGPMESLNRIPKDMKRIGRGYENFQHIRNRFLFSQRKNAALLGCPKTLKQVYNEMPSRKKSREIDPYLINDEED